MAHAGNDLNGECFALGVLGEVALDLVLLGEDLGFADVLGDNKELVTAHPYLDTVLGDNLRDRLCNAVNGYISDGVSVCVVKYLKVVKINIDKVDLAIVLGVELLREGCITETVVQACHGVLRVESLELLVHEVNLMTLMHAVHSL